MTDPKIPLRTAPTREYANDLQYRTERQQYLSKRPSKKSSKRRSAKQ